MVLNYIIPVVAVSGILVRFNFFPTFFSFPEHQQREKGVQS